MPRNEHWGSAGGAFVHCYVVAADAPAALAGASRSLAQLLWESVSVEDGPHLLQRDRLATAEARECFDAAKLEGEAFVYHLWPVEPQEGEDVH